MLLVSAQDFRGAVSQERGAAVLVNDGTKDDFPFLSTDQSRRAIPPRVAVPLADKRTCLVNMACVCDGYLDYNQRCVGSESCKAKEGKYCQYWCDDWTRCSTLNEWQCTVDGC